MAVLPDGKPVYVPFTVPGETVLARVDGQRGNLREISHVSPQRQEAICKHFGKCGGCALQHWQAQAYAAWKRELVVEALAKRGLGDVEVSPLVDAHGVGRRRATLSVENGRAGFLAHRSHKLVPVDVCPVLVPELTRAAEIAAALINAADARKMQKVYLLAGETGLDVDLPGIDDPELEERVALAGLAERFDIARLTASGELIVERRKPVLKAGQVEVCPPPGGFAQATAAGETALAQLVCEALKDHGTVADLFCGWGSFALRLANTSRVLAVEMDKPATAALEAAVRGASGLKPVVVRSRDLMRDPLVAQELKGVTGVVFDPPRAGAAAQAEQLAGAKDVSTVVGVSCDAGTFARDAAMLVAGGFTLKRVVPVDQFRWTAHVEMAGVFER